MQKNLQKINAAPNEMSGIQPFISIIVPVYNVENWLPQCLDSVLDQNSPDWECIIVNDCTPDGSGAVADRYAERDPRFTVIHKSRNEGVCAARNTGINAATGRYFICLDGDDWLCDNAVSDVMNNVERHGDIDYIIGSYYLFDNESDEEILCAVEADIFDYSAETAPTIFLNKVIAYAGMGFGLPGRCVFNRQTILDNSLQYDSSGLEDMDFAIEAIMSGQRIGFMDSPMYYYRSARSDSLTNMRSAAYVLGILDVMQKWCLRFDSPARQGDANAKSLAECFLRMFTNYATDSFSYAYTSEDRKRINDAIRDGLVSFRQTGLKPDRSPTKLLYGLFKAFGPNACGAALRVGFKVARDGRRHFPRRETRADALR
jgi:GT2 family glycosyltransferase